MRSCGGAEPEMLPVNGLSDNPQLTSPLAKITEHQKTMGFITILFNYLLTLVAGNIITSNINEQMFYMNNMVGLNDYSGFQIYISSYRDDMNLFVLDGNTPKPQFFVVHNKHVYNSSIDHVDFDMDNAINATELFYEGENSSFDTIGQWEFGLSSEIGGPENIQVDVSTLGAMSTQIQSTNDRGLEAIDGCPIKMLKRCGTVHPSADCASDGINHWRRVKAGHLGCPTGGSCMLIRNHASSDFAVFAIGTNSYFVDHMGCTSFRLLVSSQVECSQCNNGVEC